tara:strand:+ start:1185 stop:1526 length:342 start_codon:yes stop_codon:yes gene_type:complete
MTEGYQCPFYGFSNLPQNTLIYSGGNQCALITNSFSPCQMEMRKETPDWTKCNFNQDDAETRSGLEKIFNNVNVWLTEHHPEGTKGTETLPFKQWYDEVMQGKEKVHPTPPKV